MSDMDWGQIATILATGFVTFGGVWVKGRYDAKIENQRLAAQERASSEERQHDLREKAAAAELQKDLDAKAAAGSALKVFGDILGEFGGHDDGLGTDAFQRIWLRLFDASARQAAELIVDTGLRDDIVFVIDALASYEFIAAAQGRTHLASFYMTNMIRNLVELAGAAARGQEPSEVVRNKVAGVRDEVTTMRAWLDSQEY